MHKYMNSCAAVGAFALIGFLCWLVYLMDASGYGCGDASRPRGPWDRD
jgi:hypothetical protein